MVAPFLVISVALVAVIVRVQPSSVASDRFEPSIAVIVIWPRSRPNPPRSPKWPGPGPPAFGAPLADGVVGVVVEPDGDGDAPMAATAPTSTRAAVPVTMPTRTSLEGRRSFGFRVLTRSSCGSVPNVGEGSGWTWTSGTKGSGSDMRFS